MYLPSVSIRRPVMAIMLATAMVVFGLIANLSIGVSLFPDVDFPIITITTVLPNADPVTVEQEVTEHIEEAVATLPGIKHLRSASAEGICQVFVEFEIGTDVDQAAQDVRDKVSGVTGLLPREAETPQIEKLDLDSQPILALIVSGENKDVQTVTQHAEDLKNKIQQVEGVGSVKRVGGREREVRVWLDAAALEAHNIAALEVVQAMQRENLDVPGGRLEQPGREIILKTKGEFESIQQFEDLVVAHRHGAPIKLSALGHVSDGLEDERTISKYKGQPAVSLLVRRQSGTNIVAVAEGVKEFIDKIRAEEAEAGYTLFVTQDTSRFVVLSIDSVKEDILVGAVFTMIVILAFLRNLRMTFVAVIVIPASLAATVFTIYLLGFTFNNLTMLGFSLAVGIVVDDAIVMLENIYRHIEMGKSRVRAAMEGASEIGFAVIAVSLTLMAVFVPVAFMGGMVGQFFYEFGVTVAAAIFWSLVLSLTLSPMLCAFIISRPKAGEQAGPISRAIEKVLVGADDFYRRTLHFVIRQRLLTSVLALLVLVAAFVASGMFLKSEFIAKEDRGEFQISVSVAASVGASPERTAQFCNIIEAELKKIPYIEETYQAIGADGQGQVNRATIYVGLIDYHLRPRQAEILNAVRGLLEDVAKREADFQFVTTSVGEIQGVSGGGFRNQQIQFNIRGPEIGELTAASLQLKDAMLATPGFTDIDTSVESGKPEVHIRIDRQRAAELGVNTQEIATTIRSLVGGDAVSNYRSAGELYDVRVRLKQENRQNLDDIQALTVRSRTTGQLVRLANLIIIDREAGPVQVDREEQQRQITVLANLAPKPDGVTPTLGEGIAMVDDLVANHVSLPAGYTGAHTGFAEIMEDSFRSIFFTMILSALVIYMLMASQFNSLVHPLTIMVSVPLAVAGALFALILANATLNIITLLGILMLFGLVTKNAIILIDFINEKRAEGLARDEAIIAAGPLRLRPILMTAVSTVAGMVPVAFFGSEGSEVRAPLAIAVMGGMILSTALTLLVIPVVYSLFDQAMANRVSKGIGRWISPPDAVEDDVAGTHLGGWAGHRIEPDEVHPPDMPPAKLSDVDIPKRSDVDVSLPRVYTPPPTGVGNGNAQQPMPPATSSGETANAAPPAPGTQSPPSQQI